MVGIESMNRRQAAIDRLGRYDRIYGLE